jgi:hypothetical protein
MNPVSRAISWNEWGMKRASLIDWVREQTTTLIDGILESQNLNSIYCLTEILLLDTAVFSKEITYQLAQQEFFSTVVYHLARLLRELDHFFGLLSVYFTYFRL